MKKYARFGLAAALATVCGSALAQAPPGGAPDGGRFGGGGRGMRGMRPAIGTVTQVDAARNAVQVQMMGPEAEARWVVISPQATMTRQVTGAITDLKPNDTIVVSGIPLSIQASQIQAGELPQMGFGGRMGGGGAPGGPGGPPAPAIGGAGGPGGPGGGMMAAQQQMARATGRVVTTNPLVVMLPNNVRVQVTTDATTRVTRMVPSRLADLKRGDTLIAMGQTDDGGNLVATTVMVGVEMGAGFGGFGGFRGGGFGGPGRRNPDPAAGGAPPF